MNRKDIIERVASGLRRMDNKPDAFVFAKELDWVWDEEKILDIPVLHSHIPPIEDSRDIPYIPLWNKQGEYSMEVHNFNRGYEE